MNPHILHDQLSAAVAHHIRHYLTDLTVHDLDTMLKFPGEPFLHFTHLCGTHLVRLPAHDSEAFPPAGKIVPYLFGQAGRVHICNQIADMAECIPHNCTPLAVHHFDGRRLHVITAAQAIKIARDHVRAVQAQWFLAEQALINRCAQLQPA